MLILVEVRKNTNVILFSKLLVEKIDNLEDTIQEAIRRTKHEAGSYWTRKMN
jgi:hypothetical protein